MNRITNGKIDLDLALSTLRRKGMEPVANLLQCMIDNQYHAMQHEVSVFIEEGVEFVKWREERCVDDASQSSPDSKHVHDTDHFGVRA